MPQLSFAPGVLGLNVAGPNATISLASPDVPIPPGTPVASNLPAYPPLPPPPRPTSTYPRSGFDRPGLLTSLLGSFWQTIYGADGELAASLAGLGRAYSQAQRDLDETLSSVAFADIPLRHVEEWTPLTLLRSDLTNPTYALNRFSDPPAGYFGSAGLFGVPTTLAQFPVSIAPADAVPLICDAVVDPAICLVAGIDYRVDPVNMVAWLTGNPFANPLLTPTPLFNTDGSVRDYQLTLWAWQAASDTGLLQRRIGYALGAEFPSTPQARELAVTLVDALVNGTSELTLRRLFSALYDAPLARDDGEVVDVVTYDSAGLFVATDRCVYRFPAAANPVVSPGQVLSAGDPLADTLSFAGLSAGVVPPGVPALGLGPQHLGGCYPDGVVFADLETPVDAAPAPPEG